jgi:DNA polymerase-3 subunit delta'
MSVHPWNAPLLQRLSAETLPHALLLSGAAGIGKRELALALAARLMCERGDACGVCNACRWLAQGAHPDLRVIEPEMDEDSGKVRPEIRIEQIRTMTAALSLSAHQHGWRIVVICPVERMNAAAANALLKTLEEPPPQTLLILVSHHPRRLLATVRSRCRLVAVGLPPTELARDWLLAQGVESAEDLLAEAGGAPLAALELADAERSRLREGWIAALARPDLPSLLPLAAGAKDSLAEAHGWLTRWLHDLAGQRLAAIVRYFPRQTPVLTQLAGQADLMRLLSLQKRLQRDARLLRHPLNPQLLVEGWLIEYAGVFSK